MRYPTRADRSRTPAWALKALARCTVERGVGRVAAWLSYDLISPRGQSVIKISANQRTRIPLPGGSCGGERIQPSPSFPSSSPRFLSPAFYHLIRPDSRFTSGAVNQSTRPSTRIPPKEEKVRKISFSLIRNKFERALSFVPFSFSFILVQRSIDKDKIRFEKLVRERLFDGKESEEIRNRHHFEIGHVSDRRYWILATITPRWIK